MQEAAETNCRQRRTSFGGVIEADGRAERNGVVNVEKRRGRSFTVLMIVLVAALVFLVIFFVTGMFGLIGDAPSASHSNGTLDGEPLTVSWTLDPDGMAVFTANIPAGVTDIDNIEWTETDVVDGKEQSLFHDGPTETELSIRAKDEGTTTITTVVTTASGEVASTETVVDWAQVNQDQQ